ncbi:MAG TPA: dihydrolipoyl dehydrogenase [Vicinamibacteria bacterium]|nr:dihydrolipoyl dehydrogenase [Vicinamibacteria bacterium]
MTKSNDRVQVAVVGGGPGGYAAAFRAADHGLSVALVDPEENPGGVCLYRGCIPSKALLHVTKVLDDARAAAEWGIRFADPEIDLEALRGFEARVVEKLTRGLGDLRGRRDVRYVRGLAGIADAHTLEVDTGGDTKETIACEHIILATGSKPMRPSNLWIESPRVLDSSGALALDEVPKSLLVVGGGYIGLELGSVYASLGSRVSVVEMTEGLLPGVDRDLVGVLEKRVKERFDQVLLGTKVERLREMDDGIRVSLEGEDLEETEQRFEKVLIAVGRSPNTDIPGLGRTKVQIGDDGFLAVSPERRTAEPSIFAIGDIAGEPMLAHKASHEGKVAADVIAGEAAAFEPRAIPAVVFTDPEIAWCGLSEEEAKEEGIDVETARFPWEASGRATTLGGAKGLTKLIVEPESGRLLGAGFAGPGAGELVSETVLAIEMGATTKDLELSIHPHPTLSETVMEAAEVFLGHGTHVYRR